ncbi:uncharacterized protein LOC133449256 [Cololabis saira]|uniref:uncharacterized protein LOC133449256 n=1 Tax=Cololabis saira TaxID=129043 RepID=UPI002AD3FD71|nr:uncharacterized protein LOC133449256 [Cololabis saira]
MRKRMRMKLVLVVCVFMSVVCVFMSVVTDASPGHRPARSAAAEAAWTTGSSGVNLDGKMFTLSIYHGGITFFAPYFRPPWLTTSGQVRTDTTRYYTSTTRPRTRTTEPWTRSYPTTTQTQEPVTRSYPPSTQTHRPWTRSYPTTTQTQEPVTRSYPPSTQTHRPWTRSYPPWTTALPTRGVSVCFRFITDNIQMNGLFTLSPSGYPPLELRLDAGGRFELSYGNSVYLRPAIRLWPELRQNMWNNICLTVDSVKSVAQMFADSNMSIRKLLPNRYVWSGEPEINFSGFDGQLTDVQVWDYPLRYKEVLYFMSRGSYGPSRGSVLSWSHISYSRGNALLEDVYEQQIKSRARQLGDERKTKKLSKMKKDRKQVM